MATTMAMACRPEQVQWQKTITIKGMLSTKDMQRNGSKLLAMVLLGLAHPILNELVPEPSQTDWPNGGLGSLTSTTSLNHSRLGETEHQGPNGVRET